VNLAERSDSQRCPHLKSLGKGPGLAHRVLPGPWPSLGTLEAGETAPRPALQGSGSGGAAPRPAQGQAGALAALPEAIGEVTVLAALQHQSELRGPAFEARPNSRAPGLFPFSGGGGWGRPFSALERRGTAPRRIDSEARDRARRPLGVAYWERKVTWKAR